VLRFADEGVDSLRRVDTGSDIYELVAELFPLTRSITGDGVRATLAVLTRDLPIEVHEVPSGTPVLDWTVPPEWNLHAAWIARADGTRVVDAATNNLHVVSYSEPVHRRISLGELRDHLHTLPDRPAWIPYRTSYYSRTWGFCLSADAAAALDDGEYEVCIDATLDDRGSLTYGELVLPGTTDREILVSTHTCHPSLANDNCSGLAMARQLALLLADRVRRHTFRFLFVPGTIGSITWLARHDAETSRIAHGLVLTGLGDRGAVTYKRSRRGAADIDRAAEQVLATSGDPYAVVDFSPYGYDERQYCSPGFDLPVGRFGRSPHSEYPEYHTSADDLEFVDPDALADSFTKLVAIIDVLERDGTYRNLSPKGEPQLGRRGLYRAVGGGVDARSTEMAFLWVLNLSDGTTSLLDIARRSGLAFDAVHRAAELLEAHELLARI
jgi:aminopeptidase-like protein